MDRKNTQQQWHWDSNWPPYSLLKKKNEIKPPNKWSFGRMKMGAANTDLSLKCLLRSMRYFKPWTLVFLQNSTRNLPRLSKLELNRIIRIILKTGPKINDYSMSFYTKMIKVFLGILHKQLFFVIYFIDRITLNLLLFVSLTSKFNNFLMITKFTTFSEIF